MYGAIDDDDSYPPPPRASRHDTRGFGEGTGYQRQDRQRIKDLVEEVTSNIYSISGNATTLERSLSQIGTPSDCIQLRDRVHKTAQNTNAIVNETAEELKELKTLCGRSSDKQERLQYQRLTNEFRETVKRYQTLQKRVADRVKATAPLPTQQQQPQRPQSSNVDDLIEWGDVKIQIEEDRIAREQQRRAQMQVDTAEIDAEMDMLREREERIRQLEGDILDINSIFRELGTLVHEQGEVIDSIENHVESAYDQVEAGTGELRTAASYQRKARKKMCCLALFLLVLLGVVALVIYLSVRH